MLVVDDESFHLDVLSALLNRLDVTHITRADSGARALQVMANQPDFDLLITDLHMPDMDGFIFMEQVARVGYTGALIIASGQNVDVMRAASLVALLRRFTLLGSITKPVSRADLSELISKLL